MQSKHAQYLVSLPADWHVVRIEELGSIVSGGTPSRNVGQYWGGYLNWVTPSEITRLDQKMLRATREKISAAGLRNSGAQRLPVGSLLVTSRATIGYIAVTGIEVATNQGFKSIVPSAGCSSDFYYHLLNYISAEFSRLASGSTFLEISRRDFGAIKIPKPLFPEQHRIAEILDTVDTAIQHTEVLIAKLKQMKAGLLHDLLTRGLDEHGQLRDPVMHPEQFRDSPLRRIPREWDIRPLESLMEYISYGFTNPMPTTSDGPWMITAFDVGYGYIGYDQARHTSETAFRSKLTRKSKPAVGDVLVTKDGTLGRIAVVDRPNICINQSVACLRPLPDTDIKFVVHFLRSPQTQDTMVAEAGGSTIKHIYITKLAKMLIPVPAPAERERIVLTIDAHDSRIRAEEAYRDKLKQLKQGLMDDLLTGRVRVVNGLENEQAE